MTPIIEDVLNKLKPIYNQQSLTTSDNKIKTLLDSCLYFLYKNATPNSNWFYLKNNHKAEIRQIKTEHKISSSQFLTIYLFHSLQVHPKFREDFKEYILNFCPNIEGNKDLFFKDIHSILKINI